MPIDVIIGNHQERVPIPEGWLMALEHIANDAVAMVLARAVEEGSPLQLLGNLEVALIDDAMIDQVHRDFMDVEGATDVITFHHGEIVISAETALRNASEYQEPPAREILRYFIHGLLHLAGHDDHADTPRARMEEAQEAIVTALWQNGLAEKITHTD